MKVKQTILIKRVLKQNYPQTKNKKKLIPKQHKNLQNQKIKKNIKVKRLLPKKRK